MTILYYDETYPSEQLGKIVKQVKKITKDEVLVLPKSFDILLDCSLDQLVSIKGIVDAAINLKLQMLEPSNSLPQ
jgi:hypothetical protein